MSETQDLNTLAGVPPVIDELVLSFCKRVQPDATPVYVPVRPEPNARPRFCNQNLPSKIDRDGGEVVYGWAIWRHPTLIEAEFHTVWRSPEGELVDITPKEEGETKILFLPDQLVWDGTHPINNKRQFLTDDLEARIQHKYGQAMDALRERYWRDGQPRIPSFEIELLMKMMGELYSRPKGHVPCPCRSGSIFRKCCGRPQADPPTNF